LFQLKSNINSSSEVFQENEKSFKILREEFYRILSENTVGGTKEAVRMHRERGKLLARERIDILLDPDTPFLELSPLAAYGMYENQFPSAGIITGIGVIHGHETVIIANDATVKGGTYIKETIKKHLRAQEIALENHLPCVYLVDSGGVFLPRQDEVFPDKHDFGRIFFNQSVLSARKIPQISIVMGSCTAGGAYVPAMSDETIMVRGQATIFLGGPHLVKAATGEDVTSEELGGAEVHTSISGVADHLADNDTHAIQICRNIFETLPFSEKQILNTISSENPIYESESIYGLIPSNPGDSIDPYEVIMRICDGSRFHEFKKNYGASIVTGFAHIMGFPVGIVANNGILFSESALKATHFIELCNYRQIPLVFLQNITGFMVGKEFEHKGIAKDGAKMVHAVATSVVPKFTVIIGNSYGAGNYAMAGRAYEPRFLFMWTNARIAVMGGEQAAGVLSSVKKNHSAEEKELNHKNILEKYKKESSAYYSTSNQWDDGIIDPASTREVLGMAIAVSLNKKFPAPNNGIYRM
jgi:3-methylcrotonyl-CoA carboxylase beta subunit